MADWNWKAVRQYVSSKHNINLSCSSCLNYLHRLGFVLKRPKKCLKKADEEKRTTFVGEYVFLCDQAKTENAKIFFFDEAHFRADVELRARWTLRGEATLVGTTSPSMGEKATYYSGICLETGEVEAM